MQRFIKGISVYDYGDPRDLPIVFIHGFAFSAAMWEHQVAALSKRYYCVTYDVRGLGRSEIGDGQYTMEMFADDLFFVIESLELDRPVVVGLSMGGYIALRAVERKQELFRALVLCDTKSEADDDAGKLARAQAIKSINRDGMKSYAPFLVSLCFSADTAEKRAELYRQAIDEVIGQNPIGVKGCLLAIAVRTDTTAGLSKIDVPTLIVVGENDALTPPSLMRSMKDKINKAEFAVISDTGHMAPLENPLAVNQVLESFLANRVSA
ncbi:MAG: alpha/beta fold hydrolase [Deltaproteobacteria bacterium]|nr:alpha/beta fold hydrolase [Deltaproteobacteria bacterium]